MLPTLEITPDERTAGIPTAETVQRGATALRAQGCVLLPKIFEPDFIAELRALHFARNAVLLSAQPPEVSGQVGNRRFQSPVDISGAFNTPQLYANPFVLPIIRAVLGDEAVLGGCGTVTSLPGAQDQHVHRDGPPLFNKAINRIVPAHALDFFVPLVDFNATTGTTRLFPGTHLDTDANPATSPSVEPVIPAGSCLLMDYRLFHQGLANRSEAARPLLYFVYHQPWFKDYKNHAKVPFFQLKDAEYARIPESHRRLFSWIEHYRTGLY